MPTVLMAKKFTACGSEFQMREGVWIGAKFGFFAVEPNNKTDRGFLDIDWIKITNAKGTINN